MAFETNQQLLALDSFATQLGDVARKQESSYSREERRLRLSDWQPSWPTCASKSALLVTTPSW